MSKPSEAHAAPSDGHSHPNLYDTQQLQALSDTEAQTELLVLSRDRPLIEIVRAAAPRVVRVVSAADLDEAADMPGLNPGVLVIDVSITADIGSMLPQLTQHFPEIVIIVAGKRDDVAALMRLTAAGRIFRFLLVPLAHGQTRLALGAAVAQHLQVKAANIRTGEVPAIRGTKFSVAYLALGVGLLVVVAGIWFGVGALTAKAPARVTARPAQVQEQIQALPPEPDPTQAHLQLAKAALEQGHYIEPAGDNALDFYRKALELDPDNAEAQAGVRSVADGILENAERALTAERIQEAVRGIEIARGIDAAHPRLEFLDVQVARERERLKLDQERDRANRVRRLVQQASADMQRQRLLRPTGANARDALLEARRLDPADPAVALGMSNLATALTEAARRSVATGDTAQARELIDAARKLGSADASLAAVERSLTGPTTGRETLAARPAPTPAVADNRSAPAAGRAKGQSADESPQTGATAIVDATDLRPGDPAPQSAAGSASPPAPPTQTREDQWLQAVDLPRTREVAPDYPTQAFINGTEGWVDVDFTISPEGEPENLRVRDSSPRRVFDRAALDSVRQWRFAPITENGVPVARRATLRVRFQRQ